MDTEGALKKMNTKLTDIVEYQLPVGDNKVDINALIGKKIKVAYSNKINCIQCGRETKTSFAQGFCFPCFKTHPAADECILHPEKCRAHEGISRDLEWSKNHCLQDHYVYLALSSHLKVGVTRKTQIPTRWIDQGAVKAIKLATTPNRHTAGLIEVALKNYFADKTNWQRMLKNQIEEDIDLIEKKQHAWEVLEDELQQFFIDDDSITTIKYPLEVYPKKVKSIALDKKPEIEGILTGIKGQYLILDNLNVINIRKHGGYNVRFSY